ncbi:hypothetical protein MJO28_000924 [Puccinia striiformis f. sp. tritici]|uniref:Uncharacterized protein n=1 Tax=Puccinia striiformis f. sp. tritici TaxID=168172 RepID=A0ACC0F0X5_9BASI|nr:hypothetical protein MJO28_000924 [Puccinia striiformis f. sp. tritici]
MLLKKTENGKRLPTWRGEVRFTVVSEKRDTFFICLTEFVVLRQLYLEYHCGTYTSHGSIKRHNRKSKILLREIEYFATSNFIKQGQRLSISKDELDHLWEIAQNVERISNPRQWFRGLSCFLVLLCQFHDILPGSSIAMVYDDVEKRRRSTVVIHAYIFSTDLLTIFCIILSSQLYAEVFDKGERRQAKPHSALYESHTLDKAIAASHEGGSFVGLNTLSFPRQEIVRIPLEIYDGRSAFTLSKVDEGYGFLIAKDRHGNGLIELDN